jgi:hypothetical protein
MQPLQSDPSPSSVATGEARQPADPLHEVDEILNERRARIREAQAQTERTQSIEQEFLRQFHDLCDREVAPAMQAVLDRLRHDGGGGLIQTHPGGEPRFSKPSVTLWMSLEGEIIGSPREDRDPYFRIDADPAHLHVEVRQGDMWEGGGTHSSGPVETWRIEDTTFDRVELAILRVLRAAA